MRERKSGMKKHWIVKKEPLAGSSTSNIIRLLFENRFRVHPKYFPRLFFALFMSVMLMPLRMVERIFFFRKIRRTEIKEDPIFIIGLWRSGSTYLNTLLSKNKNYGYPHFADTILTTRFSLAFPNLANKLVDKFLPETRPFDNVKISSEKPSEMEHSLISYCSCSFTDCMIFPRNFWKYASYATLDVSPRNRKKWLKWYLFNMKKITYKEKGKKLMLKNPSNTGRIKTLLEFFPNAKFIHLHRNPYYTYASSINLHIKTREVFSLQKWDEGEIKKSIFKLYQKIYEKYSKDISLIPKENFIDISYEEFIENPLSTIEKIHRKLKLDGFMEYKNEFQDFIQEQEDFKPNVHQITDELIKEVNANCHYAFEIFGYEKEK